LIRSHAQVPENLSVAPPLPSLARGPRIRFVVAGAGAIGAFVGATLARSGADVVLVARGPHLEALQKEGVTVISPDGDFHVRAPATDDLGVVAEADVVVLSMKSYSLPAAAPLLARSLAGHTTVITAQNGIPWWYFQGQAGGFADRALQSVDPGGVISESIDPRRVVGCVTYCSTEVISPGTIRHIEGTRFVIGEPSSNSSDRCREIARAFVDSGLKCSVSPDIRTQIWLKVVGNVAFNPVSALTRATLGELGNSPEMLSVLRAIMAEAEHVASGLGVSLPLSIDQRLAGGIAVGNHRTSMLQDLEAGKALEIDCLTGAVCELADILEIPVPYIRTVDACVRVLGVVASVTSRA
jgi:2-dehydropantoate 2-reductase